jgi:hypothetical protein
MQFKCITAYRANKMPNPLRTTEIWREEAHRLGIGEIFLCRVESFPDEHNDPGLIGFDAAVEFQPDWTQLGLRLQQGRRWNLARKLGLAEKAYIQNGIYDYADVVQRMLAKPAVTYKRFPCVTPSWDNTSRRKDGNATILRNSTPDLYGQWLSEVIRRESSSKGGDLIVFINAWNEWAEGNHLEPCQQWGHAYLEATQRALIKHESAINLAFKPYELSVH